MHPFLRTHLAGEDIFVTSGVANPRSVRDEMRRAHLLAAQLAAAYVFPEREIVVIGAGVAGLTFASCALALGAAKVTVVEARPEPFGLQRGCNHRLISPTLYDWPATSSVLPALENPPAQLPPFVEGAASDAVQQWDTWLEALAVSSGDRLELRLGCVAHFLPTAAGDGRLIGLSPSAPTGAHGVLVSDLTIDARGFQPEGICTSTPCAEADHFHSFRFWDDDTYDHPGEAVLVSGGGDGALQDFLRVAAPGHSTRQLLACFPEARLEALSSELLQRLDHVTRHWTVGDGRTEGDALRALEAVMDEHASELVDIDAVAAALDVAVQGALTRRIALVHPGDCFDWCYPLNRFLALALLAYARKRTLDWQRVPDQRLVNVQAVGGHECAADAASCAVHPHVATFLDGSTGTFDTVIVRHGASPLNMPPEYGRLLYTNGREHLPIVFTP